MEEAPECRDVLRLGGVVVGDFRIGEEDAEQVAPVVDAMRHTGRRQRLADHAAQLGAHLVEMGVYLSGCVRQRGQAGCRRSGIAAQRSGLIDRAGRCQQIHQFRAARHRRHRQATAHDLTVGEQVRCPALGLGGRPQVPGGTNPEAGEYLVQNQLRAETIADLAQPLVEPIGRDDDAHIRGHRLGDDRGDLLATGSKDFLDQVEASIGQHDRVSGSTACHPGRIGQAQRRHPRSGRRQQRIAVPVVATRELDDRIAPGRAPGQPHSRHDGFGAAGGEPHPLDRLHHRDDCLGERQFGQTRRAERR